MVKINKNNRRSIRLAGYDYRATGGYFVTICTAQKRCVFGKIANGVMQLHPYGKMLKTCWCALPEHFGHVVLDEYAVMPNHFHGVLIFKRDHNVGAQHAAPECVPPPLNFNENQTNRAQHAVPLRVTPESLGAAVRSFKAAVTRQINIHRAERNLSKVTVWQRNYYERIIRDENELNETRRYIIENPLNWPSDEHYRL